MFCIVNCSLTCALQQLIVVASSTGQSPPVAIYTNIATEHNDVCYWGVCVAVATLECAMHVPFVQPVQHL